MAGEKTYLSNQDDLGVTVSKQRGNHVLVKAKADLPSPAGGVITLVDNTSYEINGIISLGTDRIVCGISNIIYGIDKSDDRLVYTGTSNMISSSSQSLSVHDLSLVSTGVGSKIFSVSGSGTEKLEIYGNIIASSVNVGEITGGFSTIVFRNNVVTGCAEGLTVSGVNGDLFITDNPMEDFTGTATAITLLDSGASYHTVIISRNMFEVASGQTALNISTSISVTSGAIIAANAFEGVGTYLTGINPGTDTWLMAPSSNVGISGLLALDPFQIVSTTYATTTDGLGLTTDSLVLIEASRYQPYATSFKSRTVDVWLAHGQSGEQVVTCLADNNAATGDKVLGFGFTGKFTITNITWQSGTTVRVEFDGKNGETTIEPFDLTRVNVGETATFSGCTNAANNGTYTITAVNDTGTKYVEISNPARTSATGDETLSPGEAYGGSVLWKVLTTATVYEKVTIPSIFLPSGGDIRAGLRRGTISGGNPTINISNTGGGGEDDGWITPINF